MIENSLIWLSYFVNIIVAGGWIFSIYNKYYKKRFLATFLGGEKVSIYFPVREGGRDVPVIAHEDFSAASHMATFIEKYGLIVEFKQINPNGSLELITDNNASIVICGPKTSNVIQELIKLDPKYEFSSDVSGKWRITDKETKNNFYSPIDREDKENKDIAYVARLKRASSTEKNFLLIAGIHAAGSMGAVHYLADHKVLKKIDAEVKDKRFSMAISSSYKTNPFTLLTSEIFLPIKLH